MPVNGEICESGGWGSERRGEHLQTSFNFLLFVQNLILDVNIISIIIGEFEIFRATHMIKNYTYRCHRRIWLFRIMSVTKIKQKGTIKIGPKLVLSSIFSYIFLIFTWNFEHSFTTELWRYAKNIKYKYWKI